MKKSKINKGIKIIFLFFLTLVIITGIIVIRKTPETTAAAAGVSPWDSYTNDDEIEGTTYEVGNYPENLYAKNSRILGSVSYNNFSLYNNGDDYITKIVPKELFAEVNETLFVGKEYGFFISTKSAGTFLASTVLVFDIITNKDLEITIDNLEIKVQPIFQYKYAYLKPEEDSMLFFGVDVNFSIVPTTIPYNISEGLVIAMPVDMATSNILITYSSVSYGMVEEFFLKDISFAASLFNEQELNRGDTGYDPYSDIGSYITSYDYTYQGKYREYGEFSAGDAVRLVADVGALIVPIFFPPAAPVVLAYSYGMLLVDTIDLAVSADNAIVGDIAELSSGKLTVTNHYENRNDQLKYYKDINGDPFFTKSAAVAINTGIDKSFWYGVDDSATAYFRVNHSALNGQAPNYTRFISEVGIKIVKADGDSVVAVNTGKYSHDVRKEVYKTLNLNSSAEGYALPDGTDYFKFMPQYSGTYVINLPSTINLEIKNGNSNVNYTKNGNKVSVYLKGGTTYNLNCSFVNKEQGGLFNIEVRVGGINLNETKALNIDANGTYIIEFNPSSTEVYKFAAASSSVKIWILNNNLNLLKDSNKNYFYQPVSAGQTIYVLLTNTSNANINTTLSVNLPETLTEGQSYTRSINTEYMKDYIYYKFVASASNNYSVTFKYGSNVQFGKAYFPSTDSYNSSPFDYTYNNEGITVRNIYLQKGQAVYFGVSLSVVKDINIKFAKSDDTYKWAVDKGNGYKVIDNNILIIPRGANWGLKLMINENYVVCEPNSERTDYEYSNNRLYIHGDAELLNVTKTNYITFFVKENSQLAILKIYIAYESQPDFETYKTSSTNYGIKWNNNLSNVATDSFKISLKLTYANGSTQAMNDLAILRTASSINLNNYGGYNNNIYEFKVEITKLVLYNSVSKTEIDIYINNPNMIHNVAITNILKINPYFSGGDGTALNPFTIKTAEELKNIAKSTSSNYKLLNAINLSGAWTPISTFYGTLDGNGYSISGFTVTITATNTTDKEWGFFKTNGGTIKNLTIICAGVSVLGTGKGYSDGQYIVLGLFAGINAGTIDTCTASTTSNAIGIVSQREYGTIGGIAGRSYGTINKCKNYVSITGSGDTGGIAGRNESIGVISTCENRADISYDYIGNITGTTANRYIGGIAGIQDSGFGYAKILGCYNNGTIKYITSKLNSTTLQPYMGQILGYKSGGTCGTDNVAVGYLNAGSLFVYNNWNQKAYIGTFNSGAIGRQ